MPARELIEVASGDHKALIDEQGATLVLVTHEETLAACADRRILLRDGRVVNQ